jgi:hypothetical protein
MTALKLFGRGALVALGLTVVQAIAAGVLLRPTPEPGASTLTLALAANLLAALVYVHLAERSPARGGPLVAFLLAVAFGIPAVYLVEAVFFDIGMPSGELPMMYLFSLAVGVVGAVLAAGATGKLSARAPEPQRPVPFHAGRYALSALSYVFFYFAAGMIAWPFLKFFYEGRAMPAVAQVALLQVFRGAALSLIVWLIARNEPGGRGRAAFSAGLTLSVIGGVAPLMVPDNPYLPDAVRHVHLVEVGVSNFLFGALAVWLMRRVQPTGLEPTTC